jgi:hypothetical protein
LRFLWRPNFTFKFIDAELGVDEAVTLLGYFCSEGEQFEEDDSYDSSSDDEILSYVF